MDINKNKNYKKNYKKKLKKLGIEKG